MSQWVEIAEAMQRALDLPVGPARVASLEHAVAAADAASGDDFDYDSVRFTVRSQALWPLYESRRADLMAVYYAWCLACLDRRPDYGPQPLLWKYRWVIDLMPRFSAISRAQIDATWLDMRDRYRAAGRSARSPWTQRVRTAMDFGDAELAALAAAEYPRCGRDDLSDSAETERLFDAQYAAFRRDDPATIRTASQVLATSTEPYYVAHSVAALLPALTRAGRVAEAKPLADRAGGVVRRNTDLLSAADAPVTFWAVVGDLAAATKLFNRFYAPAVSRAGDLGELHWQKAALFLARELVSHHRKLQLKVPEGLIPGVTGTRATPGELRDWLEVEYPALCAKADARNGNRYYTDHLADLDDYQRLARKLA